MLREDKMQGNTLFSEEIWQEIASIIASSFAMSKARADKLRTSATAKLIAAIPFLAGCREPERTALAHLATYIVASDEAAQAVFDHKPGDDYDVFARLAPIAGFEGGDPAIINRGMKLLAINLIAGYRRDLETDRSSGHYNPIRAGTWNADDKLLSLTSSIASIPCEEMDQIMTSERATNSWWDPF
jgi:hypothetical protein